MNHSWTNRHHQKTAHCACCTISCCIMYARQHHQQTTRVVLLVISVFLDVTRLVGSRVCFGVGASHENMLETWCKPLRQVNMTRPVLAADSTCSKPGTCDPPSIGPPSRRETKLTSSDCRGLREKQQRQVQSKIGYWPRFCV